MKGNTTVKRQKFGNGSSMPTMKRVINGAPPSENQGEKPGSSRSNIPPHYKMPTTIFLNEPIKIYEFYLAIMETIEINLILQMPLQDMDLFLKHCNNLIKKINKFGLY